MIDLTQYKHGLKILDSIAYLKLVEYLPQVGSFEIDVDYLSESNIFLFNESVDSNKYEHIDETILYDYIINTDYQLLIGRGHFKLNKKKEYLISAGRIGIGNNGRICYIDNDSGHYLPSFEHTKQIAIYFNSIGMCVDLSELKIINIEIRE